LLLQTNSKKTQNEVEEPQILNSEMIETHNEVAHFSHEETPKNESLELSKVVEEASNDIVTATGTENSQNNN
jgi:hypothetical protein